MFNQYGLVIGIVRNTIVSSAELNFAVSSNAIYEALGLKSDDHPDGFDLGLTQGVELRDSHEIDADWAIANAARIEAEKKAKAATEQTESEKLKERSDELIRANNERVLKSEQNAASASSDARLKKAEQDLQEAFNAGPHSETVLQDLKIEWGIDKATGELKIQRILDLTAYLLFNPPPDQ